MKRIISLILCAGITAGMLSGCSDKDNSSANNSSSKASTSSTQDSSSIPEEPRYEPDMTELHQPENPLPDLETVKSEYTENQAEILEKMEAVEKSAPCINITTEGGQKIKSRDKYTASVIDVFNCDDEFKLSAAGGVKVRGNSTADQGDEKPYRIKFEEKHNMLGLHDGNEYKSWVLLRSYWNFAPDYTAFNLAKAIFEDKYYCTDCMYVNLYINGKDKGVYVLCEQNQAADGRISVNDPKKDDTDFMTGYLIEMDNYPDDDHPFFTYDYEGAEVEDIAGEKRQFAGTEYSLKSDLNTKGQLDFAEKYTEGCFKILYEAAEHDTAMKFDSKYDVVAAEDMTPQEAVEAVIDTESLANMLILEELVHNYDVGEGSFYMAVDFTEDSIYQKMTFLAPWDFNWAYEDTNSKGYYAATFQPEIGGCDRSNPWFITAMKADWFKETVKAKWASLKESGAINDATKKVLQDAEAMRNDLEEDDQWRVDKAYDIVNFVLDRADFLDGEWI